MWKVGIDADEVTLVNLLQTCKHLLDPIHCKSIHLIIIQRGYERRDTVTWSTMIAGFTPCGMPDEAIAVFQEMNQSAMIAAYSMNGLLHYALALVGKMRAHGLRPNPVTTLSVLSACSHGGLIEEGLLFFHEFVQDHAVELRLEH
ncbi:Pentatricopeptide repeat-containing protein [Camellia lanceoleosa]|uniref:Pentatricopeptide repeat-containing protein n=1 Tax=Camellia lanceoleosa TaxID=1840588 RepID=A0ACC0GHN8_9ERIC|nr:Pentatricopeptide repeat-containing protein [Camellia lanceoleosa]